MSAAVAEGETWTPERRAALAARLAALPCTDQVDALKDLVIYCDQQLADARAERDRYRARLATATEFTVGDRDSELDPFAFVSVQWRRDDLWVARVGDMKTRALTADLNCEWEASPSNRTDDFREACYCPLPEALDRAERWLARRAASATS